MRSSGTWTSGLPIAGPQSGDPPPHLSQINSLLTEVSSWIDLMASPSNLATLKTLIRAHCRPAPDSGIELVVTTCSSSEPQILLMASPANTPCTQQAKTRSAPFSFKVLAPRTRVPPV